jgi:hypothetical protein
MSMQLLSINSTIPKQPDKGKWATIAKFGILRLRIMYLHKGLELRDEMGAQYMNDI